MSTQELGRLEVVQRVLERQLTHSAAATSLGLSTRQMKRLVARYRRQGAAGLGSGKRGKPSNHRLPTTFTEHVVALVRESGLWLPRAQRRKAVQQPRARRDCFRELIQIDGSEHHWFEDRGPACSVLTYVDDATSRLQLLRFVEGESTFDYMRATRTYLERYGKPYAFYSDKHTVFHVSKRSGLGGTGMTQYGRALHVLGIEIPCANTPAAKGRVARAHGTLQDRRVKEMRLEGISTIADANAWIGTFVEQCNARFAKPPRLLHDVHRPVQPFENLDDTFTWQEPRTLSQSLSLQYV